MFVAYNVISAKYGSQIEDFGNPATFPEAFSAIVRDEDGRFSRNVLVDDMDGRSAEGELDVSTTWCYLFYAKDKATLCAGFATVPPTTRITAGRNQLAYLSGSYDFEKIGAWARNKIAAGKLWRTLGSEKRAQIRASGMGQAQLETAYHRTRLMERGYFLLVGRVALFANIRSARKMIGSEHSLGSLGRMLTGREPRLSREDAVGVLIDQLNL